MKNRTTFFALLPLIFGAWLPVFGQPNIALLRDINQVGSSEPDHFIPTNGQLFFLAYDGLHDRQFWVSNGQPTGTKWINIDLEAWQEIDYGWRFGEKIIFIVSDQPLNQLWVSDGSEVGTFKLADISTLGFLAPPSMVEINGNALLLLADKIWMTDGTQSGTWDISSWVSPGSWSPGNLTAAGDRAFFSIDHAPDSTEVWVTDGTAIGTSRVLNLSGQPFSIPRTFFFFNNKMYFTVNGQNAEGLEFWASNGTAGGTAVFKSMPDSVGNCEPFNAANGKFYFKYNPAAGPNPELWSSDGTSSGTHRLDILPTGTVLPYGTLGRVLNEKLIFDAFNSNGHELWITDGSPAGTAKISDLEDGTILEPSVVFQNKLYFFNDISLATKSLWATDGTANGTISIKMMGNEAYNSLEMVAFQNRLFFSAYDSLHGQELWSSDGTTAGTSLFTDLRKSGDAAPLYMTIAGEKLFFSADDHQHDRELWVTEGESGNTLLTKDIYPGYSAYPRYLTELGDKILFMAENEAFGEELWVSDGTEPGTQLLKDIVPGGGSSQPIFLTNLNGKVFFKARTNQYGAEVWTTDGTTAGTQMLKDILPGNQGSNPRNFMELNGKLFFTAKGGQLWTTDGTSTGTFLVKIMSPNSNETTVFSGAKTVNGKMYLWVKNNDTGFEPWVSDGTAAGTFLLKDLKPGIEPTYPVSMLGFGGQTWFTTDEILPNVGNLWKTDGTPNGTELFTTPDQPDGFEGCYNLMVFDGKLYFSTPGGKIWATDGSPANTYLVVDLMTDDQFPAFFMADYSGWLWFAGFEAKNGFELWRTNGTAMGTEKVVPAFATAINPLGDGNLEDATVFKGELYFTARFDENGSELYKLHIVNGVPVIAAVNRPAILIDPNPATTFLRISNPDFEKGILTFSDPTGRVVLQETILGDAQREISVADLPPGAYFWKWTATDGLRTTAGKVLLVR